MSELQEGQELIYVPGHHHWHEVDSAQGPLFDFTHGGDGQLRPDRSRAWLKGQPVSGDDLGRIRSGPDGKLRLGTDGPPVEIGAARHEWHGIVRREITRTPREVMATVDGKEQAIVIFDEAAQFVLDVAHPNGFITLHLPLDGPYALKHDPDGKEPHSYHLQGERK